MIALLLSPAWNNYYASSPYRNLLGSWHDRIHIMPTTQAILADPVHQEMLQGYEALVVDDVLAQSIGFFKGLKFMVGGDPHAHRHEQVTRLEAEYASVDYVLSTGYFSKKLPQYLWPSDETRKKHIFFPHSVPDFPVEASPWRDRFHNALLSGSISPQVYPFRDKCLQIARRNGPSGIAVLNPNLMQHDAYFNHLAGYRMGITCGSVFDTTIAKHFEIPWVGSVLLSPRIPAIEEELLGFIPNETYVVAENADLISATIAEINANLEHFSAVADAGMWLTRANHTAHSRLDYISKLIDKIKAGGFKTDDAFTIFKELSRGK